MARYNFCFQVDGKTFDEIEHDCGDDLEALRLAQSLSEECDVQIWIGERLVAHVKEGNAPSTVRDAQAG